MIYRSNLAPPAIQQYFAHLDCRPMPHSKGHSVLSDFADYPPDHSVFGLYKNCGFWTHDEAAILYAIAGKIGGDWLDIGAHTGWTAMTLLQAGWPDFRRAGTVLALEPMLRVLSFRERFLENTKATTGFDRLKWSYERSDEFFARDKKTFFRGVVVDGDHSVGKPLEDARGAVDHLEEGVPAVIMFHDLWGEPTQEAVRYLKARGFQAKVYHTPHGVACCWRGEFTPPEHTHDARCFVPCAL